ncbi:unnamed protein product [Leuciscus chuanchicus]
MDNINVESVEKECGALGGLFQAIVNDMKGDVERKWRGFHSHNGKQTQLLLIKHMWPRAIPCHTPQWHWHSGSMMFASEPLISVSGTFSSERVLKIQIQASPLRCRLIQMLRCSWSHSSSLCDWTLLPCGSNADMLFVLASLSCCYFEMGKSMGCGPPVAMPAHLSYVSHHQNVSWIFFVSSLRHKANQCRFKEAQRKQNSQSHFMASTSPLMSVLRIRAFLHSPIHPFICCSL